MAIDKELKTLLPDVSVKAGGEDILIRPFPFGKLPKVIALIGELGGLLTEALSNTQDGFGIIVQNGKLEIKENTILALVKMMSEGGESILNLVALGANKPREWVDTLESDEGIEILAAVIEVNMDFFKKRLMPILQNLMKNQVENPAVAGEK